MAIFDNIDEEELSMETTLFTARQIMTTAVVTVGPDTPITEVADVMERCRVSGLPVVDQQQNLLGIISEYDLLQSIVKVRMHGTVGERMSKDIISVDEDASLVELIELFVSTRVRRVPVVTDGKLVGVISRRDLVFAGKVRHTLLVELPEYVEAKSDTPTVETAC